MTEITVGDTRPSVQYDADGAQSVFAFPFPVIAADHLRVVLNDGDTAGAYAVTGVGDSNGGSVAFDTAPSAGTRLTLYRDMPVARTTDFIEAGDFRASALNGELDRLAMMLQQVAATTQRCIRRAPSDPDQDLILPTRPERADTVLGFDGAGRPVPLTAPRRAAEAAAASADAAADAAATAAADAVENMLAAERRRADLVTLRLNFARRHPDLPTLPDWGVDARLGAGLDLLTIRRASPATLFNEKGDMKTADTDTARIDHDPVTGETLGLLVETERTNVLRDSLNPTLQTRTLVAGTYTVSMRGGGQVDLSGAAVGTAAADTPFTFTLGSNGDVTFTPTGDVTAFQCEAGTTPTSMIVTPVDAPATRKADRIEAISIGRLNLKRATVLLDIGYPYVPATEGSRILSLDDGSDSNRHNLFWNQWLGKLSWFSKSAGVGQSSISALTGGWGGAGTHHRIGLRLGGGVRDLFVDGSQAAADTITEPMHLNTLRLGNYHLNEQQMRGHIRQVAVWNTHLADAELTAVTT